MGDKDCEDCGTKAVSLEKVLAVTGLLAGLLIVAFAVDLLMGGKLSGSLDSIAGGNTTGE
jgi:hypothetical protein